MKTASNFLLEIFLEEMPHEEIVPASRKLVNLFEVEFKKQSISFTKITPYATPRRLAVLITGIPTIFPAKKIIEKGPPVKISFQGNSATPVLLGWTKKLQLPIPELSNLTVLPTNPPASGIYLKQEKKGDALVYFHTIPEKKTSTFLAGLLPSLLAKLTFEKMMYWKEQTGPFLRPVHSLCALLGNEIIPFEKWGITADNFTWGHSQLSPEKIVLAKADKYEEKLLDHKVIACLEKRKKLITEQIEKLEQEKNISVLEQKKVISLVANLTEYPYLILAKFDKEFLDLPEELIISELVEQQKYFPVAKNGKLINQFVITSNIQEKEEVKKGNQRVLRARLNDGRFLYQSDLKLGLLAMHTKLKKVIFQEELGTYQDKLERVLKVAHALNAHYTPALESHLLREAVDLIKNDLTSSLVQEFPHLQGVIGYYYALVEKREPLIAQSIKEHYYPFNNQSPLPRNDLSIILSLSDKIDNVLSLLTIGLAPTASQDRYGLKRQGFGIIRILIEKELDFDLFAFLANLKKEYSSFAKPTTNTPATSWRETMEDFFRVRFTHYLQEKKIKKENWLAISKESQLNPYQEIKKIKDLEKFQNSSHYSDFLHLFKRIENIIKPVKITNDNLIKVIEKNFSTPEEKNLYNFMVEMNKILASDISFYEMLASLKGYQQPLQNFFNKVIVNHNEEEIKENRHNLLRKIHEQIKRVINPSILYHKQS